MKITFFGGVRTVTGSCTLLEINGKRILIECGMHQGEDADEINLTPFPFKPEGIDALFLTHAHIDHSGLAPKLVKEGFTGSIIATKATADLADVMLRDSAGIQEKDAEWLTKKSFRAGKDIVFKPLYTVKDVAALTELFERKDYGKIEHFGKAIKYRFLDAGHILGSGTLELWYPGDDGQKKIVFSGDIGRKGNPVVNDPRTLELADYVVVESTYGNRLHKGTKESVDELVEAIKETFRRGGNVMIPAFAVGRTQDLLYILNRLVKERRLPKLDVYIDSPLAEEATRIYLSHPELFDEDAIRMFNEARGDMVRMHFTTSVEESQNINRIRSGAIIIAGSGMCTGGRIRHHFKQNLWRPECSVIFVGFQARGTLGRNIVDGAKKVWVLGDEVAVKSRIYTIGGFSAHADQQELLEWLSVFTSNPRLFVVHGEELVSLGFAELIKQKLRLDARVPLLGESFNI